MWIIYRYRKVFQRVSGNKVRVAQQPEVGPASKSYLHFRRTSRRDVIFFEISMLVTLIDRFSLIL